MIGFDVRFPAPQGDLVGEVVDTELAATVAASDYILEVDVDGESYRALWSESELVT